MAKRLHGKKSIRSWRIGLKHGKNRHSLNFRLWWHQVACSSSKERAYNIHRGDLWLWSIMPFRENGFMVPFYFSTIKGRQREVNLTFKFSEPAWQRNLWWLKSTPMTPHTSNHVHQGSWLIRHCWKYGLLRLGPNKARYRPIHLSKMICFDGK